jgi:hypothetical protein
MPRHSSPLPATPRRYDAANRETMLDVAIYHPLDRRDPHHWAIYILSPTRRGSIHQVQDDIDGRGYHVARVRWNIRPNDARMHRVSV